MYKALIGGYYHEYNLVQKAAIQIIKKITFELCSITFIKKNLKATAIQSNHTEKFNIGVIKINIGIRIIKAI